MFILGAAKAAPEPSPSKVESQTSKYIMYDQLIQDAWEAAASVPGMDKQIWRHDPCGSLIKRNKYDRRGHIYGWMVEQVVMIGAPEIGKVQAMQCHNHKKYRNIQDAPRRDGLVYYAHSPEIEEEIRLQAIIDTRGRKCIIF